MPSREISNASYTDVDIIELPAGKTTLSSFATFKNASCQIIKYTLLAICYLQSPTTQAGPQTPNRPKLLVVVVIDQFRADYLTRFENKFLPATTKNGELGGFKYLMSKGAYFPFGQYDLLQSMTGPGHATILTGSYPYQAGIPINEWFDSRTQKPTYCTVDPEFAIVTGTQTEGAQPKETLAGRSPNNLIATTVGDELKNSGIPSRVVSVSIKDRAAILLGGHRADLAIWYQPVIQEWVTSRYYLRDGKLPDWLGNFNRTTIPGPDFLTSAGGARITEKLAETAIEAFKLGRGSATDLFAVSFSTHDYLGHAVGPNSPNMEEMTLTEDKVISRFLNFLSHKIPGGLANVVIAFTGDHGMPPNPEWAKSRGIKSGRIDEKELAKSLSARLDKKFGPTPGETWIPFVKDFNFYFNHPLIESLKLSLPAVELEARNYFETIPGVAFTFSSADYDAKKLPPGIHERQILHTYFKGRSGDVIIIPKPYFMPGGKDETETSHLTGYSYDRTVPIILAGYHIKPGIYSTQANVIDIAPTLSFLSMVLPPSMSEGRVLSEAIRTEGLSH